MPAQPPFLTPTRTPAIGFSARAEISLMRAAAASLRRMTCNLGLGFVVDGVAIVFLVESIISYVAPRGPERNFPHHMFKATRASSDMRLWSQGGSQTTLTATSPTPGTLATAFSTMFGSSAADGQFGVVRVMSTVTLRSSAMSTL